MLSKIGREYYVDHERKEFPDSWSQLIPSENPHYSIFVQEFMYKLSELLPVLPMKTYYWFVGEFVDYHQDFAVQLIFLNLFSRIEVRVFDENPCCHYSESLIRTFEQSESRSVSHARSFFFQFLCSVSRQKALRVIGMWDDDWRIQSDTNMYVPARSYDE